LHLPVDLNLPYQSDAEHSGTVCGFDEANFESTGYRD
jgi:hypothetical protein